MGRIYDYKVNYSKYLELRKERREQQQKAYDDQQKFIARNQGIHRTVQRHLLQNPASAKPRKNAGEAGTAGSG